MTEKICNLCGNSCCPNEKRLTGTWQSDDPHGLIDAQVLGGYESYYLLDMNRYTFSFCESCLRKLFEQCKVKPKVHCMNFPNYVGPNSQLEERNEEKWEDDQKAYEYREWMDAGKHHEAYLNKRCNRVKDCPNTAIYTVYISDEFTEECVCEDHKDNWKNTINASFTKFVPNVLKPFL